MITILIVASILLGLPLLLVTLVAWLGQATEPPTEDREAEQ